MPNTETVRALVSAFNINNYDFNAVKTNFTLQSRGGEDCIVVSFDEGMNRYQCKEYLDSIKRKMVGEFYDAKEGRYEVVLNTGKSIFDVKSFPFNNYKGCWSVGKQGGIEFLVPIDEGVIFNLKSHLAASLAKDVREDMPTSTVFVEAPDKKGCLWLGKFPNKESCKEFEREFLSRMRERYENVPNSPLKVKGNSVYIEDVFNDARFIDSVTRRAVWLVGRDLQADSKSRSDVRAFKDLIIEFINQSIGLTVAGFVCDFPLGKEEATVFTPVVLDNRESRVLASKEALKLNYAFNGAVFNDLYGRTQGELSLNGYSAIYSIDFSNPEISHCVITKIIESSVINKDHELSIGPELHFRALSPAQSPFNSPAHAGPSGLRTPPNQRKADTDSGYDGNSPPKRKDSAAHSSSGDPGPSSEMSQTQLESPTRSQDGVLGESPRQGSEETGKGKEESLRYPVNLAGTSKGFWPSTLSPSYDVPGPSKSRGNLSSAATSTESIMCAQQTNRWSSQGTSGNKWQPLQFTGPGPSACTEDPWSLPLIPVYPSVWPRSQASSFVSEPSSWRGANPVGANPWSQPIGYWSSQSSTVKEDCKKIHEVFEEAYEKIESDSSLSKEEQELFKKLLYWFNCNNYALDPPHTNFIVKNGKIASLIDDSVDVKEHLEEVRNSTIEEYYPSKEKAKEACDLNEFPFKFLSSCEENQETTVVANISRGALLNLKELFSREHEGKVEIKDIDINIVEKAVKSEKDKWVNLQVQEHGLSPKKAIKTCYPDESVLEYISITKDKGGYWINRDYDGSEVKSFRGERWPTKGTRNATATFKKIEESKKDDSSSGYSSGFVTDAENVSSKAEAKTSSGYESMDCENTGGKSPKRKPENPLESSPEKSLRRDSSPLSMLESLSLSSSSHQIGKC